MVVLSNPGTHPEIQHSKIPKIQKSRKMQDSIDVIFFWIFGFLDFLIFCVLRLRFQSVETAPKLDLEKNSVCIGIYSVFKGCACRRGGDHIRMYTRVYRHVHYVCQYVYTYMYVYIYI